jgi:molybdate transport system regulatory protein
VNEIHPRLKLWLEKDGQIVMSDYRVRLLERIAESGSLSQAATGMNLSYRRAWGKVKELEENLGVRLVESEVGGAGGGHTTLSPTGLALVRAYRSFQDRMAATLQEAFETELAAITAGPSPETQEP